LDKPYSKINLSGRQIYIITPTFARISQRPDLVRFTDTVRAAGNATWIVIEDAAETSTWNKRLFDESELSDVVYINAKTPEYFTTGKGIAQRNAGLRVVYERECQGPKKYSSIMEYPIVYFGDDDNTFDHRLWKYLRENLIRVVVANVGMISFPTAIEGPETELFNTSEVSHLDDAMGLNCGKGSLSRAEKEKILQMKDIIARVIGFSTRKWLLLVDLTENLDDANRPFPMDMAGFAFSVRELCLHGLLNSTHTGLHQEYTNRTGVLEVDNGFIFY
jgi:hypothetical protein